MTTLCTSSVPELIAELRAGRMIILVDDEDRENEGDFVVPAQLITAAQVVEMQLAKLQALVEPFDEGLEIDGALADDSELPEHLLAALAVYERKGTGG